MHVSLRRRFEQNQEDCTFTVLAILPTATENILDAIPVEQILDELQKHKAERLARSVGPSEIASSAAPSVTDEDSKSLTSFQSESYVHASQTVGGDNGSGSGSPSVEGGDGTAEKKPKKSKAQLWNEMKISCMWYPFPRLVMKVNKNSYLKSLHTAVHPFAPYAPHTDTTEPPRSTELPRQRCLAGCTSTGVEDQPREP